MAEHNGNGNGNGTVWMQFAKYILNWGLGAGLTAWLMYAVVLPMKTKQEETLDKLIESQDILSKNEREQTEWMRRERDVVDYQTELLKTIVEVNRGIKEAQEHTGHNISEAVKEGKTERKAILDTLLQNQELINKRIE